MAPGKSTAGQPSLLLGQQGVPSPTPPHPRAQRGCSTLPCAHSEQGGARLGAGDRVTSLRAAVGQRELVAWKRGAPAASR